VQQWINSEGMKHPMQLHTAVRPVSEHVGQVQATGTRTCGKRGSTAGACARLEGCRDSCCCCQVVQKHQEDLRDKIYTGLRSSSIHNSSRSSGHTNESRKESPLDPETTLQQCCISTVVQRQACDVRTYLRVCRCFPTIPAPRRRPRPSPFRQ
jgi:hypothetical protein